jgi:predicted DCC family thiol-disulfide oxidoreductase YuxK
VIVLYDAECGFCRWATAWALRLDDRHQLLAAPIQSPLGSELLADLGPVDRLGAAHVITDDGRRFSGGAAAAEVLSAIDRTGVSARLARGLPRTTDRIYGAVATRRKALGHLVGERSRQRADRLLEASSLTTADDVQARSPQPPARRASR